MLIAFIGPDGAGKSTIIEELKLMIPSAVFTREGKGEGWQDRTVIGQTAARSKHVDRTIAPSLAKGKMIVADRYYACTAAYQGTSPTHALDIFRRQKRYFPAPYLWVFVSAPASVRRARLQANGEHGDPALFAELLYRSLIAVGALQNILQIDGTQNARANAALVHRRIGR